MGLTTFLIGAGVLLVVLWAVRKYVKADARRLAELAKTHGRKAVGVGILGASAYYAVRGNYMFAMLFAPIGLGLLKSGPWTGGGFLGGLGGFGRAAPTPGQTSSVRSAYLDMTLSHDTGQLDGRVVAGAFAGRALQSLTRDELLALHREVLGDPDSTALAEAYLDGRLPGWREHVHQDAGARQRGPGAAQPMSDEEAYQILGLEPGAGADAIKTAHRTLMKRMHPDQGGSTWLAAKINQAKDVLLRTHR